MSVWDHSRNGRIEGEIVQDNGTFVDIKLSADHRQGAKGEILTVRRYFLTEVPETKEADK